MANNFSTDLNCVALYRFEPGALSTDSKGENTLTPNNSPSSDNVNFFEGSGCVDFESTSNQYFNISDASLEAGFPLKSGDTNKKISICGFFCPESLLSAAHYLVAKGSNSANTRSVAVYLNPLSSPAFSLALLIGYGGGASWEIINLGYSLVAGRKYHFGVTFDDSTKAYLIRVWDITNNVLLGNKAGTSTNNVNVEAGDLYIGSRDGGSAPYDGTIDELVFANDIFTSDEIDQIRQGAYGPGETGSSDISISATASVEVTGSGSRAAAPSVSGSGAVSASASGARGAAVGVSASGAVAIFGASLRGTVSAVEAWSAVAVECRSARGSDVFVQAVSDISVTGESSNSGSSATSVSAIGGVAVQTSGARSGAVAVGSQAAIILGGTSIRFSIVSVSATASVEVSGESGIPGIGEIFEPSIASITAQRAISTVTNPLGLRSVTTRRTIQSI